MLIEKRVDYSFYANHSLDGPMDFRWWENANIVDFVGGDFITEKVNAFQMGISMS